MNMRMNGLASLSILAGMAFTASASLTVINSDRFIQCAGSITEDGSPVAGDGGSASAPSMTGAWSDLVGVALNFGGGSANGAASQNSDFGQFGINFAAIADVSAGGYVTTILDDQGNPTDIIGEGSGSAWSYFRVRFNVGYTGLWRLQASSLSIDGGTAEVYLTDHMGNVQLSVADGGSEDQTFVLNAGVYELWGQTIVGVSAPGSTFSAARGEFTGSLTPVPAPGATALLGMGLLAAGRRRR
jgi:MYXO-CTERM domain-containing protein